MLPDRIASKIGEAGPDGCWPWKAYVNPGGYGRVSVDGHQRYAHRVVYELLVGPIPEGMQIDHLCRVRHCVNPAHMEPVTPRVNTLRGVSLQAVNAFKTHCHRGHPFDAANTIPVPGGRSCRACQRENERRYRIRRTA